MSSTESSFSKVFTPAVEGAADADELLNQFLEEGGCSTSSWESDALSQLNSELRDGSATLGLKGGAALRVVSVAKPIVYDGSCVLIEAFQSFPDSTGKKPKVKCSGVSEKFNPSAEACKDACVRALTEELHITVAAADFGGEQKEETEAASKKFAGLASEYHLYYCALTRAKCVELQKSVPLDKLTAMAETGSDVTNPKTMWWAWCPDEPVEAIEAKLEKLTADSDFEQAIDFRSKIKQGTPGEQVRTEFEVAKKMEQESDKELESVEVVEVVEPAKEVEPVEPVSAKVEPVSAKVEEVKAAAQCCTVS